MSRLYDRLSKSIDTQSVDAVIVADNVADYRAWHEIDHPTAYESFPNIAPPFTEFFVDIRRSAKMPDWYPMSLGVHYQTFDPKEGYQVGEVRAFTSVDDISDTKWTPPMGFKWGTSRWGYVVSLFLEYRKNRILVAPSMLMAIREDGTSAPNTIWLAQPEVLTDADFQAAVSRANIVDTKTQYGTLSNPGSADPNDKTVRTMRYLELMLCAPFMAICFMNCKNVELIDNAPPVKLSERHRKEKGVPLTIYKTIKVNSMRTAKHYINQDARHQPDHSQPSEAPLHIVRGHFKDFRDGKGLFGKFKGVYWWDQAVRGSAENGEVIKDYNIQAAQ